MAIQTITLATATGHFTAKSFVVHVSALIAIAIKLSALEFMRDTVSYDDAQPNPYIKNGITYYNATASVITREAAIALARPTSQDS